MLKANDVARQLYRLSQPRPQCFLFSNMAAATKKTCWYLCFYVVTLFDKNFLHTLFCFYFAFVSLVPRFYHGFSLAAILNIISISISISGI